MVNLNKQYTSFLGGEVSQRLYHRADMSQFGKWFSEATNLRFYETGSFRNRPGFEHVSYTKNNLTNDIVKLLSFSFNDEQSYLVELGSTNGVGYARFFQDGKPIMVDGQPYEIKSPFSNLQGQSLRYAQAGDILFITNEKYGLYELRRLEADGTSWEFKKFDSTTMPLGEVNEDENEHLSGSAAEITVNAKQVLTIAKVVGDYFSPVSLYLDNQLFWSSDATYSFSTLATALNTQLASKNISVSHDGPVFTFSCEDFAEAGASVIRLDIGSFSSSQTKSLANITKRTLDIDYSDFASMSKFTIKAGSYFDTYFLQEDNYNLDKGGHERYTFAKDAFVNIPPIEPNETKEAYYSRALTYIYNFLVSYNVLKSTGKDRQIGTWLKGQNMGPIATVVEMASMSKYVLTAHPKAEKWWNPGESRTFYPYDRRTYGACNVTYEIEYYTAVPYSATAVYVEKESGYLISASSNFFADMDNGDTFAVRHHLEAKSISETFTNKGQTSAIEGNGKYRYYTSGNWVGEIAVQYSYDKGLNWKLLHTIHSNSENAPGNDNTSGDLERDDTVLFRVEYNITSGSVNFVLETSPYEIWAYYKILGKVNDYSAYVSCLKNDVGEFTNENEYKKNAFSDKLGYPSCIGFYQNRLFLGKDYYLYGSAVSDFWNFYERAENIQDDDAIQMSLLSYKVNKIRNIATQRSLFVFTEGAEFGISSEGAITQADKFLKQLSSHGSADCEYVLTGDIIVFVDKTRNTTRALQYSFETDAYEASDVSIFLKQKLENERFIAADFAFKDKEAYFVSESGTVFIMKYLPEQNILSWSRWIHASGEVVGLRVVPNGSKNDVYILVNKKESMSIERLSEGVYLDSSVILNNETPTNTIQTDFTKDQEVTVITPLRDWFLIRPDENGLITLPKALPYLIYGIQPVATGTLLTPTIQQEDQTFTTYFLGRPFKVRFLFTQSYGFKVGAADDEKMTVEWQDTASKTIDEETVLTSDFKTVLIPCRFGLDNRVSFVQDLPYPMDVQDVLIETDHGGK